MEKPKRINILADQRLLRKFCQRRNKDYNCAEIFKCEVACPLAHLDEIQYQINLKNLPFGEAYRLAERRTITEEEGRKIIKEKMEEAEETLKERKLKETLHKEVKKYEQNPNRFEQGGRGK